MKQEILDRLSQITEEEQYILVQEDRSPRSLYAKSGRFLIERRRISELSFGESTAAVCLRAHPRFRVFPSHTHDFIEIMYVCHGSITHVFGEREVRLQTDDLILLGKDARHSILAAKEGDIGMNLIISVDLFESLLTSLRQSSRLPAQRLETLLCCGEDNFCVFHAAESVAVRNLLESMIYSVVCEKSVNAYILRQSLGLLLCYLADLPDGQSAVAEQRDDLSRSTLKQKIFGYIQTSYSTATLTEAAGMMGLSPSYLSRLIEQSFGESFKSLLMKERFAAACALLRSTDMPVGDIIHRVGYENSSYFHKEFKRRYGITPGEYRKEPYAKNGL